MSRIGVGYGVVERNEQGERLIVWGRIPLCVHSSSSHGLNITFGEYGLEKAPEIMFTVKVTTY